MSGGSLGDSSLIDLGIYGRSAAPPVVDRTRHLRLGWVPAFAGTTIPRERPPQALACVPGRFGTTVEKPSTLQIVIPAQAGIHRRSSSAPMRGLVPACAGTTVEKPSTLQIVIPAQAGIHRRSTLDWCNTLSRFRRPLFLQQPQHASLYFPRRGHWQGIDKFDLFRILIRCQQAAHMLL